MQQLDVLIWINNGICVVKISETWRTYLEWVFCNWTEWVPRTSISNVKIESGSRSGCLSCTMFESLCTREEIYDVWVEHFRIQNSRFVRRVGEMLSGCRCKISTPLPTFYCHLWNPVYWGQVPYGSPPFLGDSSWPCNSPCQTPALQLEWHCPSVVAVTQAMEIQRILTGTSSGRCPTKPFLCHLLGRWHWPCFE